jgi:hypothetical protein
LATFRRYLRRFVANPLAGAVLVAAVIDHARPRADWQVSLLSKGAIEVATVSVTVGRLPGGPFCFVTAKADVGRGSR